MVVLGGEASDAGSASVVFACAPITDQKKQESLRGEIIDLLPLCELVSHSGLPNRPPAVRSAMTQLAGRTSASARTEAVLLALGEPRGARERGLRPEGARRRSRGEAGCAHVADESEVMAGHTRHPQRRGRSRRAPFFTGFLPLDQ